MSVDGARWEADALAEGAAEGASRGAAGTLLATAARPAPGALSASCSVFADGIGRAEAAADAVVEVSAESDGAVRAAVLLSAAVGGKGGKGWIAVGSSGAGGPSTALSLVPVERGVWAPTGGARRLGTSAIRLATAATATAAPIPTPTALVRFVRGSFLSGAGSPQEHSVFSTRSFSAWGPLPARGDQGAPVSGS